jgi:cysteine desulfurase
VSDVRAYLDHAATSPMPREVLAAYTDALRLVGNPASTHGHGQPSCSSRRVSASPARSGATPQS